MSAYAMLIARFRLGKIVSTPNALDRLTQEDILHGHPTASGRRLGRRERRRPDEKRIVP